MTRADVLIAGFAARQHSAVSRHQLLDSGLGEDRINRHIRCGLLVPVFAGVYRHAEVPPTWRTRLAAAVLACGPGAVASHRSAGSLFELRDIPGYRPEVTVVDTTPRLHSGIHVHRTNLLHPVDATAVDGIPVTSIERTLLDLGGVLPFEIVEVAAQDAMIRKLVTPLDLVAVLERVARRGRRGTQILRAVIEQSLPVEGIKSWLEKHLHEIVAGLPVKQPVLQFEMRCADGRDVVLDQAWPDERIAVEGDGHRWHATRKEFEGTMARRRSIMASGWDHYQYGWTDVRQLRTATRAELQRILPPR